MPETEEERLSRLNAAGIINVTLENLWRDAYSAMSREDFLVWNRKLDAIWALLAGDVKKDSEEDKDFTKIDLKIHTEGRLGFPRDFEGLSEGQKLIKAKTYILLRDKSVLLRRLQNKQGKGTAYQSDDVDDMD
jgi:hypothetical protein